MSVQPQENRQFQFPLEWDIPEDIVRPYVTNFVVQKHEDEFIMYFFESYPPLLFGTQDEVEKKLGEIKGLRARCVGSAVISVPRMQKLITLLQTVMENYLASIEIDDVDEGSEES